MHLRLCHFLSSPTWTGLSQLAWSCQGQVQQAKGRKKGKSKRLRENHSQNLDQHDWSTSCSQIKTWEPQSLRYCGAWARRLRPHLIRVTQLVRSKPITSNAESMHADIGARHAKFVQTFAPVTAMYRPDACMECIHILLIALPCIPYRSLSPARAEWTMIASKRRIYLIEAIESPSTCGTGSRVKMMQKYFRIVSRVYIQRMIRRASLLQAMLCIRVLSFDSTRSTIFWRWAVNVWLQVMCGFKNLRLTGLSEGPLFLTL